MSNREIVLHHRALVERMRETNRQAVDPQLEELIDAHEALVDAYQVETKITSNGSVLRELQYSASALWLRVEALFGPA
jgi:hypothetical protein